MKRLLKNIFVFFVTAAPLALSLTACHDDIYDYIEREVQIDESGLSGDVSEIVQFGNYLFTTNGNIFCKTNQPSNYTGLFNHQWSWVTQPVNGKSEEGVADTVAFLASDNDYLYALCYTWNENTDGANKPKTAMIYVTSDKDPTDGIKWELLNLNSITNSVSFGFAKKVFDNKYRKVTENENKSLSFDFSERKAFAFLATKQGTYSVFRLNGTAEPTEITEADGVFIDAISTKFNSTNACYFNGKTYLSPYYAMTYNDDFLYYSPTVTTGTAGNYSASASIFYRAKDGTTGAFYTGKYLLSMAASSNVILCGTTDGLLRIAINATTKIPYGALSFYGNGGSVISTHVYTVFILDPNKKEEGIGNEGTDEYAVNTIYGSIGSSSDTIDKVGLYSYYPARLYNGGWNRDGN